MFASIREKPDQGGDLRVSSGVCRLPQTILESEQLSDGEGRLDLDIREGASALL
jgi:hypothetical protein